VFKRAGIFVLEHIYTINILIHLLHNFGVKLVYSDIRYLYCLEGHKAYLKSAVTSKSNPVAVLAVDHGTFCIRYPCLMEFVTSIGNDLARLEFAPEKGGGAVHGIFRIHQ
jgi:hypothetical protein